MKTGVLLLNFGGPRSLTEVKPFLLDLFSTPEILSGIPKILRPFFARFIVAIKLKKSVAAYRLIGGHSPLVSWTTRQASELKAALKHENLDFSVELGMLAGKPSIEDALLSLKNTGVEKLILLPLFPQYSLTTAGASLRRTKEVLSNFSQWKPEIAAIESWCKNRNYLALENIYLKETLLHLDDKKISHVLFTAHSLPVKLIEMGDPYQRQVQELYEAITTGLEFNHSLCYQSKSSSSRWLEPSVEDEIARLGKNGVEQIVIFPLSFVSDHIETLCELDMVYRKIIERQGIAYYRTPSFNDDPRFISFLKSLVLETVKR